MCSIAGHMIIPVWLSHRKDVSTQFDVPDTQEPGPTKVEAVANGIASRSRLVFVRYEHY